MRPALVADAALVQHRPVRGAGARMEAKLARPAGAAFILIVAIAAAAAIIHFVQLGFLRAIETPPMMEWDPVVQESLFTLLLFALVAAVAIAGIRLCRLAIRAGPGWPTAAVAGVAVGISGVAVALGLSALAGVIRPGDGAGAGWLLLAGTVVTLVQTGSEELYFRGWLQPTLQAGWGRWPGLAGQALGFALLHFVAGLFDPLSLLNLLLAGLWLGLLAERSGGLVLPIAAHFGWNWGETLLFGATPNPGVGSFGAILDWDLVGPPAWGGSEAGLNASLSVTFVLAALVIATASWGGRVSPIPRRG
ncbi:CPBP family intramembrane metalloprotease [Sphingomonas parva]|uniref:CPBP family intramembrane metalloprotease n=1 Tax=Sphingomonas parva TaxID=2555898 RepID=A0A4Y8ZNP1_9SPHN|nr:CPBP family intramembrane glutamic endopeptidase [Sphingomonas parva]TFI57621.1 CPBP family intramembrane metalloprotease [Sphingomonas parva]